MKNLLDGLPAVTLAGLLFFTSLLHPVAGFPQGTWQSSFVQVTADNQLQYAVDAEGNRFPDFSRVGYGANRRAIPQVRIAKRLAPANGDAGQRIQDALDELATMPTGPDGLRGALLLTKGRYEIAGTIRIRSSGIVLMGEGDSTILVATGNRRRNLVEVQGAGEPEEIKGTRTTITDSYVPVGAATMHVQDGSVFSAGDRVMLVRPGTEAWIHDLHMDSITVSDTNTQQWTAKEYDLFFQRTIVAVKGNEVTLDNPVVLALDRKYGGGQLFRYAFAGRISEVGISGLRLESEFVSDTDEEHAQSAITLNRVENAWVRNTSAYHFVYAAVHIGSLANNITVDSCRSFSPKSKITGGRRYSFTIDGQLSLVKNCFASEGRHDYVTGARVCGPNVFYNCRAEKAQADTGPHHRWAVGTLYDNIITDGEINAQDRGNWGTGHGWSGVSQYFWNCRASRAAIQDPWVSGRNYVIGMNARPYEGRLPGRTRSEWEGTNRPGLYPASLFIAQSASAH